MPSRVPKPLNENYGINYAMDGFFHDMDYGRGRRDKAPDILPGHNTMSGLPDGIVGEDSDESTPFEFASRDMTAALEAPLIPTDGVVDHHWLSDAEQDPNRLPILKDSLTQLQHLWGDRSDGVFRVPAKDRVETAVVEVEAPSPSKLANLVRAMLRIEAGGRDCSQHLKPHLDAKVWDHLEPVAQKMASERGLHGTVYVYADAYPGLMGGRWAEDLAKHAKKASYIVVGPRLPKTFYPKVADTTGLVVVASTQEIPWQVEHEKVTGKTAGGTSARSKLQSWYQNPRTPINGVDHTGSRPQSPKETLSVEQASQQFASYQPPETSVPTLQHLAHQAAEKHAKAILDRWVKSGCLSKAEASSVSSLPPKERLRKAAKIVLRSSEMLRVGQYKGVGEQIGTSDLPESEAWAALESARKIQSTSWDQAWSLIQTKKAKAEYLRRVKALAQYREAGMLTPVEHDVLLHKQADTDEVLHEAARLALKPKEAGSFSGVKVRVPTPKKVTAQEIDDALEAQREARVAKEGEVQKLSQMGQLQRKLAHLEFALQQGVVGDDFDAEVRSTLTKGEAMEVWTTLKPMLAKARQTSFRTSASASYQGHLTKAYVLGTSGSRSVTAAEVQNAVRLLRTAMHRGHMGSDLTALLESRVAAPVLDLASNAIDEVRAQHEGLAGHLYVDASLYASTHGTTGCERGAAQHQSTAIPNVLAMERCETCMARNAQDMCLKYQKPLMWEVPASAVAKRASKRSIAKVASTPDVEMSASFVIDVGEERPSDLDSREFTFGGMLI